MKVQMKIILMKFYMNKYKKMIINKIYLIQF